MMEEIWRPEESEGAGRISRCPRFLGYLLQVTLSLVSRKTLELQGVALTHQVLTSARSALEGVLSAQRSSVRSWDVNRGCPDGGGSAAKALLRLEVLVLRSYRAVCLQVVLSNAESFTTDGWESCQPATFFEAFTMVSKKAVASLVLVYVVSMLAEQTEGFVPFFTQSDFRKMQEKERNREQKKSLTPLQQPGEEGLSEQAGADVKTIQLAVPVKAGMWLISRQLEKYQDVLEKLLAEVLQDTPDAD
ncbi:promotilin isoform X2 [Anser cygnoides]|uniref:promotilin isoform X2 n=1 Tax=Anser cygnoides TaxID=8845 RepID=UPI0034D2D655